MVCRPSQLPLHNKGLVQCLHYCWQLTNPHVNLVLHFTLTTPVYLNSFSWCSNSLPTWKEQCSIFWQKTVASVLEVLTLTVSHQLTTTPTTPLLHSQKCCDCFCTWMLNFHCAHLCMLSLQSLTKGIFHNNLLKGGSFSAFTLPLSLRHVSTRWFFLFLFFSTIVPYAT